MRLITDAVFVTNAAKINAEREKIAVQITEVGKLNAAVALLGAPDVRAEWVEMNISERRAAIRALGMHITLRPAGAHRPAQAPSQIGCAPVCPVAA